VDGKCKTRRGSRRSTSTDERTPEANVDETSSQKAVTSNDNGQKGKGRVYRVLFFDILLVLCVIYVHKGIVLRLEFEGFYRILISPMKINK
jgi:hypothetical protein